MRAGIRFGLVIVAGSLASFAVANAIYASGAPEKVLAAAGIAIVFGLLGGFAVTEE